MLMNIPRRLQASYIFSLGRQATWADLVEEDGGSGGDGISGTHALQVQEERLAKVVQGTWPRVEQLVVDHPCCEVVGPLPLAKGKVQSTCECSAV